MRLKQGFCLDVFCMVHGLADLAPVGRLVIDVHTHVGIKPEVALTLQIRLIPTSIFVINLGSNFGSILRKPIAASDPCVVHYLRFPVKLLSPNTRLPPPLPDSLPSRNIWALLRACTATS